MSVTMARQRRLQRIFRDDQRTVIIAMDGAPVTGPIGGMRQPEEVLHAIVRGGADAVLMTHGLARRYGHIVSPLGMILRCDGAVSSTDDNEAWKLLFGPEDALRLGADGVICNTFPHSNGEQLTLDYLARLVSAAEPWHLPVVAESLPGGFPAGPEQRTAAEIAFATRAASELGADFVKTAYTGSTHSFAEVVESSYVPVVILGGAAGPAADLLHRIADAIAAGASGVAIGRNVWQHPHPERMTRAIAAVVHEGASADRAVRLLDDMHSAR